MMRTESLQAVLGLLHYQFDGDADQVRDFINNLYNLLERWVPKKNCMEIVSPPSAGKNLFFDRVVSFMLNRGTIRNFNRYVRFPLQSCTGRRVLVWNKPNCESTAFDTIKKIFGSNPDMVAVKYSSDLPVFRTPVIVLSNNDVFPHNEAFNHRMYRYTWKTCPALKMYEKKVYPLVRIDLFDAFVSDEEYVVQRAMYHK